MIYNYPGKTYALGAICPTTGLVPQNAQSDSCTSTECISDYNVIVTAGPGGSPQHSVVQAGKPGRITFTVRSVVPPVALKRYHKL